MLSAYPRPIAPFSTTLHVYGSHIRSLREVILKPDELGHRSAVEEHTSFSDKSSAKKPQFNGLLKIDWTTRDEVTGRCNNIQSSPVQRLNFMSKFVRSCLCHGSREFDLRTDAPAVLLAEVERSHVDGWELLKRVVRKDYTAPKADVNALLCSMLKPKRGDLSEIDYDFLCSFKKELDTAFEILRSRSDWSPIWAHVSENTTKPNPRGTFLFFVMKHGQNVVISETVNYIHKEKLGSVQLTVHDAIILTVKEPESVLKAINERMAGYGFPHSLFVDKGPISYDEKERPLNLCVDRPPNTQLLFQVLGEAQEKQYVRLTGSTCLYRLINPWTVAKTGQDIQQFISNVHIDNMSRCDANTNKLFDQLGSVPGKGVNFPRFPLLSEKDIHRGKTALTDSWIDWDEKTINAYPVPGGGYCLHYYDQPSPIPLIGRKIAPFTEVKAETPTFDSVFRYQWGQDQAVMDYVQVFLGRLFFPIGKFDSWQSFLYFYGSSQSGKSTVLSIVSQFWFPPEKVRSWSKEGTFGLEGALNSWLVMHDEVIPDARDDSSIPGLSRDAFNTMTAGGPVTIAKKFQVAQSVKWDAPGFAVSNYTFPLLLQDVEGEITRRVVALYFPHSVDAKTRDHFLEEKLGSEALLFQIKCCLQYRAACTVWQDPQDSTWVPEVVKTWIERAQNDTNLCARFIQQTEWRQFVEFEAGESVSYIEFTQLLGEWRQETKQPFSSIPKKPKILKTLEMFGYKVKNVKIGGKDSRTSTDRIFNMKISNKWDEPSKRQRLE